MKSYALLLVLLLGGCFQTAAVTKEPRPQRGSCCNRGKVVPLKSVIMAVDSTWFTIDAVDSISLVMEEDYRSFKKGQRLTVFFKDGRPFLRVE